MTVYESYSKYRGDTILIPLSVSIPDGYSTRIHLRSDPESEVFHVLFIEEGNVVIPKTVSELCTGAYAYDVEVISPTGEAETLLYVDIFFKSDNSRDSGDPVDPLGDFERVNIIAQNIYVRNQDGSISLFAAGIGNTEKITGIDAGVLGEESIYGGYLYKCSQAGIAGVAVWYKILMTESIVVE